MKYKLIEMKDGKITLTKKELEELLDEVYEAGRIDGLNSAPVYYPYYYPYKWWESPSTPITNPTITWTSSSTGYTGTGESSNIKATGGYKTGEWDFNG